MRDLSSVCLEFPFTWTTAAVQHLQRKGFSRVPLRSVFAATLFTSGGNTTYLGGFVQCSLPEDYRQNLLGGFVSFLRPVPTSLAPMPRSVNTSPRGAFYNFRRTSLVEMVLFSCPRGLLSSDLQQGVASSRKAVSPPSRAPCTNALDKSHGSAPRDIHHDPAVPRRRDAHRLLLGERAVPNQSSAPISDTVF